MEILDTATFGHAKAGCYRCLRPGPVVDLDTHIEGEGTLALCKGCLRDAALAFGFRSDDEVARLIAKVDQLVAELDDAREAAAAAEDLVGALEQARTRVERKRAQARAARRAKETSSA